MNRVKVAILAVAGMGAAYLVYRAYSEGSAVVESIKQAAAQAAANVQSAWVNNVSAPFQQGQDYMDGIAPYVSSKAWLYSDANYTGKDVNGQVITDGEWYSDAVARRYDIEQRAAGATPAATSNNGAAFGVYPKAVGGMKAGRPEY